MQLEEEERRESEGEGMKEGKRKISPLERLEPPWVLESLSILLWAKINVTGFLHLHFDFMIIQFW